jgi:6-phosphogluconolactonase (cycloisomerase 2 family)
MKRCLSIAVACIASLAALGAASAPAGAAGAGRAVFALTDNTTANRVVAYDRAPDGTLTQAGSYATGGLGGQLEGSVVDHTASQGALAYDARDGLLLAVNPGSGTVSVFAAFGDRLALRQTISSGGSFPVSVAIDDGLLYVLNAEEGGSVTGYRVIGGRLVALAGSTRALGLNPSETPRFTHTPGQVAFSPDGSQLVVTTKAAGNDLDVFQVASDGTLSASPQVNELPGTVPFALAFDRFGHLLLTEAGPNALADFQLRANGELAQLDDVATEQAATCWITRVDNRFYTSNAGSASLTGFREAARGQLLELLGQTATDAGTVDSAATGSGRFLYVQAGAAGIVDEYAVAADGSLSQIGSVTVPGAAGGEGIVAF